MGRGHQPVEVLLDVLDEHPCVGVGETQRARPLAALEERLFLGDDARASRRTSGAIASRADAVRRSAGTVRVAISRLTDTRRPSARRLRNPTPARTTITRAEVRKIFEPSRMPPSVLPTGAAGGPRQPPGLPE